MELINQYVARYPLVTGNHAQHSAEVDDVLVMQCQPLIFVCCGSLGLYFLVQMVKLFGVGKGANNYGAVE